MMRGTDVHEHEQWGKYVFKQRMPTWIDDGRKEVFTDLLITRLFSWCPSLLDDYIVVLQKNINTIMQTRVDTEHAHFRNIDKEKLVELEKVHCIGTVATSGDLEIY